MSSDLPAGANYTFKLEVSENNELPICKEDSINTGYEIHGTILPSLKSRPRREVSMMDVPKTTSTASFSTTQSQVSVQGSTNLTNIGMMPSICAAGLVSVREGAESAGLI